MKILLYVAALIGTSLEANTLTGNSRVYHVVQITQTLDACNASKAAIESRFGAITGLKTLGSNCVQNVNGSANLSLEYIAEIEPTLVSTFRDIAPLTQGLYLSKEACNAALPKQTSNFETNTGLKALVAFCFKDYGQWQDDTSWTLRIDSFGSANLQPFVVPGHRFGNLAAGDVAALQTGLKAHLSSFGAVDPSVAIWSRGSDTFMTMLYYAKAKVPLTSFELGFVRTDAECRAFQSRLQGIAAKASGNVGVYMCLRNGRNFEIFALITAMGALGHAESELPYRSLAECDRQRATLEQKWRDVLDLNIVGSLCTEEYLIGDYEVRMRLFWVE